MKLLSVNEAADELGLDPSRVRALVRSGSLQGEMIGGRWVVDPVSVARRSAAAAPAGRRFTGRNAWVVLRLASGLPVEDVLPQARSRFLRSLRLEGLEGLSARLQGRAAARHYRAHPGVLKHLRADKRLMLSGISAAHRAGLELAPGGEVEAYVGADQLDALIAKHGLEEAAVGEANVCLRVIDGGLDLIGRRADGVPLAAVAIDLIESPDPRSARAGRELIARLEAESRAAFSARRPVRR